MRKTNIYRLRFDKKRLSKFKNFKNILKIN